jgi:adenosylcobinamide-phosphate synthase
MQKVTWKALLSLKFRVGTMLPLGTFSFIDSLIILLLAVLIDVVLGEPPDKFHPTVWMGKTISYLKPKIKSENPKIEKLNGILLSLTVIMLFVILTYVILFFIKQYLGHLAYIIVAAVLLKLTFAIKCMEQYTLQIAKALKENNINQARKLLPYIVRREPEKLNTQQIISAAVESIGEGTVDGITSPLFYFALFGVPGAFAFRVVNTLDSMIGYKDPEHINIGWFSARLDTAANYIPARLTAFLMIIGAFFLHENWKRSRKILKKDRNKTESINAGWTMSAMAGALNVQLEKPGFYVLGYSIETISPRHILRALRLMKLTTLLFVIVGVIPLLSLSSLLIFRPNFD